MFNTPKLKHAFSGTGGKAPQPPKPEEPAGLLDPLKAFAVARLGPVVCDQLKTTYDKLNAQNTVDGRAKDVQTHFLLQAMGTRVETFREHIMQGGAQGYAKMKEAGQYLTRMQKLGLNA